MEKSVTYTLDQLIFKCCAKLIFAQNREGMALYRRILYVLQYEMGKEMDAFGIEEISLLQKIMNTQQREDSLYLTDILLHELQHSGFKSIIEGNKTHYQFPDYGGRSECPPEQATLSTDESGNRVVSF
ncbi:MAG: hypothetical protein L3J94_09530 [Gammaproteobacteria bacterium]|nr:hypothetical protein [Gammaproteobacteria bacterium]